MSRRAAEREIELGNVTVNGRVAEAGLRILPGKDVVAWKGKEIAQPKFKKIPCKLARPPFRRAGSYQEHHR